MILKNLTTQPKLGVIPTTKIYLGGVLVYEVTTLAYILYSAPFLYTLDANGNTLMTNADSFSDATVFSGSGVELQVDNELPITIPHTLAANTITGTTWTVQEDSSPVSVTVIKSGGTDHIHAELTAPSNIWLRPALIIAGTGHNDSTKTYKLSFDLTVLSGVFSISEVSNGVPTVINGSSGVGLENGHYEFNVGGGDDAITSLYIYCDGRVLWDVEIDNILFEPVTNPNSFLTLVNGDGTVEQIDNSIAPSTTYTLTNQTALEALTHTSPFTAGDLALIEADTSLMTRLALGATDTGLSLITADVFEHYAFSEYSGADCYGTKNGTIATTTNNLPTIRENVNFNPKANQGIEFERDINGTPIAFNNTQMNMHSDTSANLLWNPSIYSEFIIEESVGLVFYSHIYDGVNLTTWTDGVEGVGVAHTPENANYLLGKGLYPKVTADPYTTYVQDYFEVILNADQIATYDALQAYNDYIA